MSSRNSSSSSKNHHYHRSNNNNNHHHYSNFHIPSNDYNTFIINDSASTNLLEEILDHVHRCSQYSIDTESDCDSHRLALLQINSIPTNDKSMVILIELNHLPNSKSTRYETIIELFRSIFRLNNTIYSWGQMEVELKEMNKLISWPIQSTMINIQTYFSTWYDWARSTCVERSLHHHQKDDDDNEGKQQQQKILCSCHEPSPYQKNQLWSLANAIYYTSKLTLDKSSRLKKWSWSLTSRRSSLSKIEQCEMIHYAVHDTLAVTYLIRPVLEQWTFNRLEARKTNEIFMPIDQVKLPPALPVPMNKKKIKNINVQKFSSMLKGTDSDLESISSDEIYLDQLIEPKPNENQQIQVNQVDLKSNIEFLDGDDKLNVELEINDEMEMDVDNRSAVVDEVNLSPTNIKQPIKIRKTRSREAKTKRNKKHNVQLRTKRYQFSLYRYYYYKVTAQIARRILQNYDVPIRHIKVIKDNQYLIGTKSEEAQRRCDRELPQNCFDKHHFERFRKRLY